VATERVDGSQGRARPKGRAPDRKGVDNLHRGGQTARQAKARAGRSKGRRGAKVLFVWKASRAVLSHAPLHAVERGPVLVGLGHGTRRASDAGPGVGIATEMSEARPHTSREEDNASHDERQPKVRSAEANPTWREPGDSPGKKSLGTHEARVLVRRSEKAEVGPTHRASLPHDEPQGESAARRWPRGAPHGVLTHAAGVSLGVRTVCVAA
jgi:hypothetical protein